MTAFDGSYGRTYRAIMNVRPLRETVLVGGLGADRGLLERVTARASAAARGAVLLDAPCGDGLALGWVDGPRHVVAVDLSDAMLAAARRRPARATVETLHGDLAALPVASESCAAALCLNGVHVLADPLPALRELWRCLRPGAPLHGTSLVASRRARPAQFLVCAWARLPAPRRREGLLGLLREAGFAGATVEGSGGLVAFACRRPPNQVARAA